MNDVTRMLTAVEQADPNFRDELLPPHKPAPAPGRPPRERKQPASCRLLRRARGCRMQSPPALCAQEKDRRPKGDSIAEIPRVSPVNVVAPVQQ